MFPIITPRFEISFDDTEIIRYWESHSLEAYLCPAGKWTISWGITGSDVYRGLKITQEQSNQMFSNRISYYTQAILPLIDTTLIDLQKYEFLALLSFTFNSGVAAFRSSTLLKKVNSVASEHSDIHEQFMRWKFITVNGKKVISKGLVKRRLSECALFKTGKLILDWDKETVDKYMKV